MPENFHFCLPHKMPAGDPPGGLITLCSFAISKSDNAEINVREIIDHG